MRFLNAARRKRVIGKAIACSLMLFLSSCIPSLRPGLPGPELPPDFNGKSSPTNSAQLTVEEFYQDPTLTALIAQALAGNQELRVREEEIQLAAAEILGRQGAFLPFLSPRFDAGLDRHSLYTPLGAAEEQLTYPGDHHFPDPLPNFLLGVDFLWRIDIWREFRNARDAAVQRYVAAIEGRNFFVTQMVAEIAENYYELMSLDQRLQILDQTIAIQEKSLQAAQANLDAGRATALGVRRFQAEVRKNRSEKLIVGQEIIQAENRINFLLGRMPQSVERDSTNFLDRNLQALNVGIPPELLLYRTDIRQAERELAATGLEVLAARARFLPSVDITGRVGFEAFNPRYLFNKDALLGNVAAGIAAPLINRRGIQADYFSANARQLQALYNYQRVILNAFTEVVNNLAAAENYRQSVEIKKLQLEALRDAVDVATGLFSSNRVEYIEVLFVQRDLLEARTVLVETKRRQLTAIVMAYQALGGGVVLSPDMLGPGGILCPPLMMTQPGNVPPIPIPPVPDMMPGQEQPDAPAPDAMPAQGAPDSPYEPAPANMPVPDKLPAQEEPNSQEAPVPDTKPAPEKPDSQDETLGRAAADRKTGLAVVSRTTGDLDAKEAFAPPDVPPPSTLFNDLYNYKYVPAPAASQEETGSRLAD